MADGDKKINEMFVGTNRADTCYLIIILPSQKHKVYEVWELVGL